MEIDKIIWGRRFFKELPEEVRKKLPPKLKRIVIDIPHDGPVRLLYEVHGTENLKSFIEAGLRAGCVEHDKVPREEWAAYSADSPEGRAWLAGFAECKRKEIEAREAATKGTDNGTN